MYGESLYLLFLLLCLSIYEIADGMSIGIKTGCDGKSRCILLQECGSFMKYIEMLEAPMKPSGIEFLMRQQCGFQEGHPKVCCSISTASLPSLSGHTSSTRKDYSNCRVKNQCILLKECKPYMDLIKSLEKPLTASVVDFLRSQQCGFEEGYPKVCCYRLPRGMLVKHAGSDIRPTTSSSSNDGLIKPSTKLNLVHTVGEVTTISPPKPKVDKKLTDKSQALNKAFELADFFDFDGPYDLFRRKRFNNDGILDVEVR